MNTTDLPDTPTLAAMGLVLEGRSPEPKKTPSLPVRESGSLDKSRLSDRFLPLEPKSFLDTGISRNEIEALVLKYLLNIGSATGADIARHVRLSSQLIRTLLQDLKDEMLVAHKGSANMGDFIFQLTDHGLERARRLWERCTYYGSAAVALDDYIAAVRHQTLSHATPAMIDLCRAFSDLTLSPEMISTLAQAIAAGKGLFLFGKPGNGKTSIAERVTRAFGQHLWIPRTISVTGELIRLFDPSCHEELPDCELGPLPDDVRIDRRWVLIRRPTIIVGGELTMSNLDISYNPATGINESPTHLKSNCGTLVVDDFGRQRMSSDELLNRWIVPLEKRYDYLNLPSGRQIRVPFEQLLVLSTNLEPRDLVDEAFLRRIPYKVEVHDPTDTEFRALFQKLCPSLGFEYDEKVVSWVLETHFRQAQRPLRFCHARDLLLQVKHLCESHAWPLELLPEHFDVAVRNYFAVL